MFLRQLIDISGCQLSSLELDISDHWLLPFHVEQRQKVTVRGRVELHMPGERSGCYRVMGPPSTPKGTNYRPIAQRDCLIRHTVCSSRTAKRHSRRMKDHHINAGFFFLSFCHTCVLIKVSEVKS